MSYQGWTNYGTWCVNLWLENEEPLYGEWTERAADMLAATDGDVLSAANDLGDALKHELTEMAPELSGVWADLLSAALSEVNWWEIARAWVETAKENMPEGDDD